MTFEPPIIFERLTRVTPLGIRFWDVTRRVVASVAAVEGLSVVAYELTKEVAGVTSLDSEEVAKSVAKNKPRRLTMFPNSGGIFILQGIPGMRNVEFGAGDDLFWKQLAQDSPPALRSFVIEVTDPHGRYIPFLFEASVPTRGLFAWDVGSPAETGGNVPLYPSPAGATPTGMVVLHADLYNPIARAPAAWAMLEVWLNGNRLARGIADERGVVTLAFPYPQPFDANPGSPLVFGLPLMQQSWALNVRVFYKPPPIPSIPDLTPPYIPPIRDLTALLAQPEADVWRVYGGSPFAQHPFTSVTLKYGHEVTVCSFDPMNDAPLSQLLVTPV